MRSAQLSEKLDRGELVFSAGAWDAISCMISERAGFDAVKLGSSQVAGAIGLPDLGILSPKDVMERIFCVTDHVEIPVIADFESGFGSAMQAVYWARQFERAGASAIHIDDYGEREKCPWLPPYLAHPESAETIADRIKEICDRRASENFLVIARSGVTASSAFPDPDLAFEESLRRARMWKEAGADVLWARTFSEAHLDRFRDEIGGRLCLQIAGKIGAGRTGDGGRTDISQYYSAYQLAERGYNLVFTGASFMPVALKALTDAAIRLKETGDPNVLDAMSMPFREFNDIVKLDENLALNR